MLIIVQHCYSRDLEKRFVTIKCVLELCAKKCWSNWIAEISSLTFSGRSFFHPWRDVVFQWLKQISKIFETRTSIFVECIFFICQKMLIQVTLFFFVNTRQYSAPHCNIQSNKNTHSKLVCWLRPAFSGLHAFTGWYSFCFQACFFSVFDRSKKEVSREHRK